MFKKSLSRLSVLLLAAVMLMSFAACGNDKKNNIEDLDDSEIEEILDEYDDILEDDITESIIDGKISAESIIFSLEFENFNGFGYVSIGQSWKNLVSDETLEGYLNSVNPAIVLSEEYNGYLGDIIEYVPAENYNSLSNGDTVYINAKITDEYEAYGITVDSLKQGLGIDFDTSLVYTVSNLPEGGTSVDIFSPVVQFISYEGANGSLIADIRIPETFSFECDGYSFVGDGRNGISVIYNNEQVMKYYYRIEGNNLSSGDEIVLKTDMVSMNGENCTVNDVLMTKGLCLVEQEKELVVSGDNGGYISSADQLSSERVELLKQTLQTYLQSQKPGENLEFKGIYFAQLKSGATTDFESKTAIFAIYSSKYELFGEPVEDFIIAPAYDVILEADGSLVCTEEYTVLYLEEFSSEAEALDHLNNGSYICTKIG